MWQILAIAAGGAIGSVFRFWASTFCYQWLGRDFPYGTLAVNIIGSLLIGFLSVFMVERLSFSGEWRAAILVGFLGGFTTFSSFSLETFTLLQNGEHDKALLNMIFNVCFCLLAVWGGIIAARAL